MDTEPNALIQMLDSMNATRWAILGIVLLGLELITGTTYILWPAVAALILAVVVFILPLGWEMQFLLFFVLSTILLVAGHFYLKPKFKSGEPSDLNDRARSMVGARVKAVSDFEIGRGRVKVGDSEWGAAMETGNAKAGDELRVVEVKGATLWVEPAG
ncbi:NfeD family protein [Litorimonas sp. RW-G-Af-16]|uniref:NfeD family protein n=1 Tax=Litorimonas sp. RW-G-Af-16 TaxID=3241168 RepID=UPI00390C8455